MQEQQAAADTAVSLRLAVGRNEQASSAYLATRKNDRGGGGLWAIRDGGTFWWRLRERKERQSACSYFIRKKFNWKIAETLKVGYAKYFSLA